MDNLNLHRMTPFEWTMTDRVARAPMEFVVKIQCTGEVDCEKFTQAILLEVKQHPLLQANAETGPNHRQSYWRAASQAAPQVHWIEEEFSPEPGFPEDFEPIDLENEIGLRFYGWTGDPNSADSRRDVVMKFVFHHACCDGKGGLDFVQQTLVRYGALCANADPTLESDLQDVQISDRSTRSDHALRFFDRLYRSIVVRPKRVACFLFQRPRLLHPNNADSKNRHSKNLDSEKLYQSPPCQCSTTIDQKTTKAIGEFAKSHSSTTNLVLARELFHTLNDHLKNGHQGRTSKSDSAEKRRFRLMIPFSLRADRHHTDQTANCVSIVYLEATKLWLDQDKDENPVLLTQLGRQMDYIRRWQMQYSWIESVESYAKFWPLIKLFKKRNKPTSQQKGLAIATTVMTNLGRAFRNQRWAGNGGQIKVGSLEVETVHVAVPCTAMLNTNFSVNFYRDRLTLDIIYLPSLVAREDAQAILDSWAQRIVRLAQTRLAQLS